MKPEDSEVAITQEALILIGISQSGRNAHTIDATGCSIPIEHLLTTPSLLTKWPMRCIITPLPGHSTGTRTTSRMPSSSLGLGSWTRLRSCNLTLTTVRCIAGRVTGRKEHRLAFCMFSSPHVCPREVEIDFGRDLKCMAKVVSGILILREGKSTAWTSDLDTRMNNWTTTYLKWLETADIAVAESKATKWVVSSSEVQTY